MNANCFKTVFSERLGCLVAVGEHACSQGKSSGESPFGGSAFVASVLASAGVFIGALVLSQVFVGLAWAQPAANALPTGGAVVQGAASLAQSANQLNITQSTQRAAINWQSFDIGASAKVNVVQPNAQAVLLNRVVGQSPSQIFGQLQANGHVILVNPNGVLFGKDGSVNAASFTASTLGITDANFMAGNMVYERNGSTAGVVNQGTIQVSPGGYVALLGASVSNEGKIIAPQGGVALGAANVIRVPVSGSGRVKLELTAADINASVSNTGQIVSQGGQVYMQALALNQAAAQVMQSGSIDTTGEQGGAVHLLADGGTIKVDGSITANSKGTGDKGQARKGGDIIIGRDEETGVLARATDVSGARLESVKGFVETSGDALRFEHVAVNARDWLLDPVDVVIDAASAATIGSNLGTTNVTIQTTGSTLGTTSAGTGNITVNSAITKAVGNGSDTTLTLLADNGITVNAPIAVAAGGGKLNVVMTANGLTDGVSVGSMTAAQRALSRGLLINNTGINANGGDITLTGTSYADNTTYNATALTGNPNLTTGGASATTALGKGVQLHNGSSLRGHNITITGTAENQAGQNSFGVMFQRYATASALTATGNINITGTLQGAGNGSGVNMATSGWGAQAPVFSAGGSFTLRANNRGALTNTASALEAYSGLQVTALGNVTVQAETNNAASVAMNFWSGAATVWGSALQGNTSFRSVDASGHASGRVLIQANQGGISFNNNITPTLTSGSLTALTDIKGVNVTVDNTGAGMTTGASNTVGSGSIDATTGEVTLGAGRATNSAGISLGDARAISASGNIHIAGSSSSGAGVSSNTVLTSAAGNITVTGVSLAAAQHAVSLAASGSLQTLGSQKSITINANTLFINAGSAVNAGSTGTVNIRTTTAGNEILVGGADTMSTTLGSQKLGLDNTELNRITAGHLVVGDTASAGNVTVSAATTTLAQTGHVTLQTGGQVAVNAALTVGDDPATAGTTEASKNLTLTGAGATSQISQTGVIKAAGLALLGNDATATLLADNQVGVLAGNLKSLAFKNATDLTIGAVNSTSGISAQGTVAVSTSSGNLTLANAVSTTDGTDAAVVLNAGVASAAGTATGGDLIAAGGTVSVGAGGRATLYTGSVAGSTTVASLAGAGRYRYNSDEAAANFTAALATGNYVVYRERPALNVQVTSLSKDYDGHAFSGGAVGAVLSGALANGDTLASATAGAVFGGTAQGAVNVAQSGGVISAAEAVTGKSALGYATSYAAGQLTITPKSIAVTGLTVDAKPYDGNAVAHVSAASLSGLVAGESLGLSGAGFFDSPNVNGVSQVTVADVGQLTRTNGSGDWANYSLSTTGAVSAGAVGKITPVALTARVNDSAVFVTQSASGAPDMGVTYSGFVNGESASSALSGLGVRTYSGAADYPVAGDYTHVYGLSAVPTANHGNYTVTVIQGALTVVPADKLLIRVDSQASAYGQQTQAVDGVAGQGTVGAYYCLDASVACNGANLVSLNLTRLSPNRWKAADSTGSFVVFDTSISGGSYSTGGYLNVGNYQYATSEISPLSLPNGNFNGRFSNAGVLTVDAQPITATYVATDKRVDGTTSAQVASTTLGFRAGDQVSDQWVSASFDTASVGNGKTVAVSGVQLLGADRANYRLLNPLALTTGNILPSEVPPEPKPARTQVKPVVLWYDLGSIRAEKRVINSDVVLQAGAAVASEAAAGSAVGSGGTGGGNLGGLASQAKPADDMAACRSDAPIKTGQDAPSSCVCKPTPIEGVQVCTQPQPAAAVVSRAM